MENKIVIAGGSGFIGKYLAEQFQELGYRVIIISRQSPHIQWNNAKEIIDAFEHSAMLINLAGKSVDCRYNKKNKAEILKSRIETTKILGESLLNCKHPPEVWINASTATIYRHAEDHGMTENQGEIGTGFSVEVAKKWEQAFFSFQFPNTRQIALRMAIVLGKNGGVIKPLINLARFVLGGKQGNGNQLFSWIHIEDLFRIILFLQSHKELKGVFNCASPNVVDNKTLMKTLCRMMNVKIGLPSPRWLLEIGAVLINTETELVLKSRWIVPEKFIESGYSFKYPTLNLALENILCKTIKNRVQV